MQLFVKLNGSVTGIAKFWKKNYRNNEKYLSYNCEKWVAIRAAVRVKPSSKNSENLFNF